MYARVAWAPVGYKGFYTWNSTANPPLEGTAVTTLQDSATGTNVPGQGDYDPSKALDNVLNATDGGGASAQPANTATAGIPGSFGPLGSTPPASPAALISGTPVVVSANPTTAWTVGQYVQTALSGTTGRAYWNGTAWVQGVAS
jgi:hypothetical protein